jgi:hypothetical protein
MNQEPHPALSLLADDWPELVPGDWPLSAPAFDKEMKRPAQIAANATRQI